MTTDRSPAVVARFAPSPTGYLHVGGARTALFSWLLARHHGGKFLLRIEDTDLARSTEEACRQLLDDLRWLGLHWDNENLVYQSKRQHVYNAIIDGLIARGLAYKAYDTPAELDARRKQAEREKKLFVYRNPKLSDEQTRQYEAEGRRAVVRFAMPVREHRFHDVVLGKDIVMPAEEAQDFVIRKADGMPTYHFAVVVDDAEMGITHVLRGQEHTKNTFYHIALQEALGYARPVYGHLPIIMNMDSTKMGKRDRDKAVRKRAAEFLKSGQSDVASVAAETGLPADRLQTWLDDSQKQLDISEQAVVMQAVGLKPSELPEILIHDFRKNGYLPEALLNFLALLGWNPGGDREHMTVPELVELFSIGGIGKSNAKFDRTKLLTFNTKSAESATPERLLAAFKDFLASNPDSLLNSADDATLAKLLQMKKGFRTFRDVEEASRLFFIPDDRLTYDADAVQKTLKKNDGQGTTALREARGVLADSAEWTAHALETAVKAFCEKTGQGLGKVAQPIRVAVSGGAVSPPIFETLELLGRDRTLARIDRCLQVN